MNRENQNTESLSREIQHFATLYPQKKLFVSFAARLFMEAQQDQQAEFAGSINFTRGQSFSLFETKLGELWDSAKQSRKERSQKYKTAIYEAKVRKAMNQIYRLVAQSV